MIPRSSRHAHHEPEMSSNESEMSHDELKMNQDELKMSHEEPKLIPNEPQLGPDMLHDGQRCTPNSAKRMTKVNMLKKTVFLRKH